MFREYQRVKLRRRIPPIDKGAEGIIVFAYDFAEPSGYEVEFMDSEGATLALLTLHADDLEPISSEPNL